MISQDAKNIMAFVARFKLPNVSELPIDLCREGLAKMMSFSKPPAGCTLEKINAGGAEALWVRAAQTKEVSTILYLHGGGYALGSSRTHAAFTGVLSDLCQIRVLSVDYRLAPEDPYPAAVKDAAGTYRWLLQQGVPAKSIVIGGDSAGGGLHLRGTARTQSQG